MTSYWPTIDQLNCILACPWQFSLCIGYHWSFVLKTSFLVGSISCFTNRIKDWVKFKFVLPESYSDDQVIARIMG